MGRRWRSGPSAACSRRSTTLLREAGVDPRELAGDLPAVLGAVPVPRQDLRPDLQRRSELLLLLEQGPAVRAAIAAGEVPAGAIDPEVPPATLADLDRWNRTLTKVRHTGAGDQVERIGLVPWGIYGNANSLFTWGWAFGGEFYDAEHQRLTADQPRVVAALEWMVAATKPGFFPLRVSCIERESVDVLSFSLQATDDRPFATPLPGQFIVLGCAPSRAGRCCTAATRCRVRPPPSAIA